MITLVTHEDQFAALLSCLTLVMNHLIQFGKAMPGSYDPCMLRTEADMLVSLGCIQEVWKM